MDEREKLFINLQLNIIPIRKNQRNKYFQLFSGFREINGRFFLLSFYNSSIFRNSDEFIKNVGVLLLKVNQMRRKRRINNPSHKFPETSRGRPNQI